MKLKKEEDVQGIAIFQKVLETARGGFTLDTAGLTKGDILPAGTPMSYDGATRKAKKANANGSDVKGLLYTAVKVDDDATVSIVTRGTVYEKRITGGVAEAIKSKLPLIIFDDSL